ncbi:MAG: UDP-N-acetylenolpyruvoylglucosamine reductase [Deltaproteobacteria bacterium]|nr:MAG: UDP-N-acetylenolpyruvoylglucosamine reductase [Deltaproteobacteria bacterium]
MLSKDLEKIEDLQVRKNVSLLPLTSFRIGGPAHLFLVPRTLKALEQTISYLGNRSISYKVLGQGSNLFINDKGVKMVMTLAALNRIHSPPGHPFRTVSVEAGCRLKSLISWSTRNGLCGLENLSGIPASVGGAISMNAGADKCSMAEAIDAVQFTGPDGSCWFRRDQLQFDYRFFRLPDNALISAARIQLGKSSPDQIRRNVRKVMYKRRTTQPVGKPSAGCVFRNPPGDSAGKLIDQCGLKGLRIGDAEVSKKHANFIVNRGKASAVQVMDLLKIIRERVKKEADVELVPEVSIWGMET